MMLQKIGRRSARQTVGAAVSTLLVATAAPYGYTLVIWGSGAVLLRSHGVPALGDVFVFVAGAIAGFNLLGLLVEGSINTTTPIDRRGVRLLAGVLDWIAVGAAVGAVSLLAEIRGWVPWLLAPLIATVLYLLIASLQLTAIVIRASRARTAPTPPGDRGVGASRPGRE